MSNELVVLTVDPDDLERSLAENRRIAAAAVSQCMKTDHVKMQNGKYVKTCPNACNCIPQVRSSAKARAAGKF
jgi:hypothetical protein